MKVGDRIGVRGPKGAFIYSPNMVKEIGMVAGNGYLCLLVTMNSKK
jgi:NAD(P)H-flavin reductase